MFNLAAYFDRIGYSGSKEPSAETLCALHRAHMLAVPFENLDIHLRRPIVCDEAAFLRKIIDERRGGFCYELNGAFAALLRALGFDVTLLSARVTRADGSDSVEFDHLALRVDLPGRCAAESRADNRPGAAQFAPKFPADSWLADVGFGDSFIEPLRLIAGLDHPQIGRVYCFREMEGGFAMGFSSDGKAASGDKTGGHEWRKQYSFTLQPHELAEFAPMCRYHQTSPESHFTQQRVCSRATPLGRITLSDLKLIETRQGQREERELQDEHEWQAALNVLFGIKLPA